MTTDAAAALSILVSTSPLKAQTSVDGLRVKASHVYVSQPRAVTALIEKAAGAGQTTMNHR